MREHSPISGVVCDEQSRPTCRASLAGAARGQGPVAEGGEALAPPGRAHRPVVAAHQNLPQGLALHAKTRKS